MLIPNKFNGFHNGVRRCFGGGGGGGGGGDGGPNDTYTPSYSQPTVTPPTNTATTTAPTTVSTATTPFSNMAVNTQQGYNTLNAMKGTPWGQSGGAYNDLLNQGFTSDQIKSSAGSMYGAPSEANWSSMVQNAGMNSPTGRPMAGSDQFYQPVYNSSYMNYARPATQFDVSAYGTQPINSPLMNTTSRNNVNNTLSNFYRENYRDNPMGVSMSDTLNYMRDKGINRDDFQAWGNVNNYGPQMSMSSTQAQQPFNPYTNSSGYGGYMPQMQNPYSYPQQGYQPQQQYNPYQMQPSFGYQQPQPVQPNYGPSSPIIGRSSQVRGTPNIRRYDEGGIASLMDQDE